jgi:hypothetical protein
MWNLNPKVIKRMERLVLRHLEEVSIVNWKGYGRKCLWPDVRYYPVIFLETLGKAPETSVGIFYLG